MVSCGSSRRSDNLRLQIFQVVMALRSSYAKALGNVLVTFYARWMTLSATLGLTNG